MATMASQPPKSMAMPIDKSMPPEATTRVIPRAATSKMALPSRMLTRLLPFKNASERVAKKTKKPKNTTKNP